MTSQHLAAILAAATTHREIATMPKDDQFVFLQACNEGLLEWHRLAPAYLRRDLPLTFNLSTPQSVTLTCTAGSNVVAFVTAFPSGLYAASTALVGCSLINGAYRYRLTSTTTLNFPWNGATGSTVFTAYGDSVQLPSSLSLVDRVVMLESGRETILRPADSPEEAAFDAETYETGRPTSFSVVSGAAISNASAAYILSVHPAPTSTYQLRVERLSMPRMLSRTDITTDAELPLPDAQVISTVVPLIKEYILGSTIAGPKLNAELTVRAAERVRESLTNTTSPTSSGGEVRTQPGY